MSSRLITNGDVSEGENGVLVTVQPSVLQLKRSMLQSVLTIPDYFTKGKAGVGIPVMNPTFLRDLPMDTQVMLPVSGAKRAIEGGEERKRQKDVEGRVVQPSPSVIEGNPGILPKMLAVVPKYDGRMIPVPEDADIPGLPMSMQLKVMTFQQAWKSQPLNITYATMGMQRMMMDYIKDAQINLQQLEVIPQHVYGILRDT